MTGKQLRAVRTAMELTQVQFAQRVGLTGNTIARMERGVVAIPRTLELLVGYVAREHGIDVAAHPGTGLRITTSKKTGGAGAGHPKGKGRREKNPV